MQKLLFVYWLMCLVVLHLTISFFFGGTQELFPLEGLSDTFQAFQLPPIAIMLLNLLE